MKRLVVVGLERACEVVDRLTPDWRWRLPGRVCRLAEWSSRLDERWQTGEWTACESDPPRQLPPASP